MNFMAGLWREYSCFMCTQAQTSHAFETQFMCVIMCAKKGACFALWLTVWLSFEKRNIFLETVLQILLICVCHISCLSTVTPSRRCFETCSVGVVSKFRFQGSSCFWCFYLIAINTHFVLAGFSAIRFPQHHPEISFRLRCKSLCILSLLSLAALRVPPSADKSHCMH